MKKFIVIAFIVVAGILKSKAQVTVNPGVRGGLNVSDLYGFEKANPRLDFYVGGFIAIKFNKYFTLQPELTYSRQGAEIHFSSLTFEEPTFYPREFKQELNYLSFDAVAKIHFSGGGFHLLGGPSLDFKVSDNLDSYKDDPIGFDFGLIGGVGYSLPMGLTLEARFKQGLIDIYGYKYVDNYDEKVVLNQVFQFGVSYTFKVKKI